MGSCDGRPGDEGDGLLLCCASCGYWSHWACHPGQTQGAFICERCERGELPDATTALESNAIAAALNSDGAATSAGPTPAEASSPAPPPIVPAADAAPATPRTTAVEAIDPEAEPTPKQMVRPGSVSAGEPNLLEPSRSEAVNPAVDPAPGSALLDAATVMDVDPPAGADAV